MKKEIADKWVAALRSGDYEQGRSALRSPYNEFCCLGVLCNIHAREHPELAATQEDPCCYFGHDAVPPAIVIKWAGMEGPMGWIPSLKTRLTTINDMNKMSFDTIADIIETHWKEL